VFFENKQWRDKKNFFGVIRNMGNRSIKPHQPDEKCAISHQNRTFPTKFIKKQKTY